MPETEIIAYHGWGFDADCWRRWEKLVSADVRWMNFDRGYFGNAARPDFTNENRFKIVITHSFGLHLCSDALFKQADLVIIFAGFLTFHPKKPPLKRRSKKVVNEMIRQLEVNPAKVLQAFYSKVFYPEKNAKMLPAKINTSLLLQDLKVLNNHNASLPELKKSAKVCIFQGNEDAIVPSQKGRDLEEYFGTRSRYIQIKGAGHALPFTAAAKCLNMIKNEMIN